MQTNIDVLKQQDRLDPEARQRLFDDLQRESHEMRDLIGGLIELARGNDPRVERTSVQLDELVEGSVERARSRFPQLTFETSLEPSTVDGVPERLERAVWNLLENAGKWSAPGATVEVTLADGELRVRDHGPGNRRRGPATRLRALLPRDRSAFAAGLRARALDRARGRRGARRHRHGRGRAGRRRFASPSARAA